MSEDGMQGAARLLVTGGAGFIGSALLRHVIRNTESHVLNVDKLTYAGNLESLSEIAGTVRYAFEHADITDAPALRRIFESWQPSAVLHLAAESHVDRSIDAADDFIRTNVAGTHVLLEAARAYWMQLPNERRSAFRFHHVSTDEVYGDLATGTTTLFSEETPYAPSSPYAATKASSDHLVRAWHRTYGLPTIVTNCSNNYGPYQFPEKLIPHMIVSALQGKSLPVYGDGLQVRDWLFVDDHADALMAVLARGEIGATYNIGGCNERTNIAVVTTICDLLEELAAARKPAGVRHFRDLIAHVTDRPGHDRRYAIDASKIDRELGWRPRESFESGLRKTVEWYLTHEEWWGRVLTGAYKLERIGHGAATADLRIP